MTNLQCSPHHVLHTSSMDPLRHKFLSRTSLLVAVLARQTLLSLPPYLTRNDLHVEHHLGAKRGENCSVPSLRNTADMDNTSNFKY